MAIPYEATGRRNQKARTREALVAAARALLAAGTTPTVEEAAAAASVSRTTAYRYFPNQRALVVAAHPEIDRTSLLPDDAPDDVVQRLEPVMTEALRIVRDWEPQLRAALRLSLDPDADPAGPVLRQGRVIGWLAEALAPLERSHPHVDRRVLAVGIRSATGIEAFVWLVDVAGLSRDEAVALLRRTARALLHAALVGLE
jgi:AcrR family transcriptional regulator